MQRIEILDNAGIPRAWAEGRDIVELIENAVAIASEYAVKRPDCVPLRLGEWKERSDEEAETKHSA